MIKTWFLIGLGLFSFVSASRWRSLKYFDSINLVINVGTQLLPSPGAIRQVTKGSTMVGSQPSTKVRCLEQACWVLKIVFAGRRSHVRWVPKVEYLSGDIVLIVGYLSWHLLSIKRKQRPPGHAIQVLQNVLANPVDLRSSTWDYARWYMGTVKMCMIKWIENRFPKSTNAITGKSSDAACNKF